ncbi:hypothetical protein AB0H12_04105 [Actinosynnema sp. NPDC023794]
MSGAADRGRLDRAEVVALVRAWHGALERHVDVAELRGRLVRSGLLLRLPGATVRDGEQFESWYRELSESCFDQRRDVLSVDVDLVSPLHAEVTVTLRWESRRWQRPAPRSRWTGCLLTEQWLVVLQDGEPRIRTLVTRTAQPLPGSPPPVGDDAASPTDRPRPVAEITEPAPAPNPATGADRPQPVVAAAPPSARITARPAAAGRSGDGDTRESRGELVAS